MADSGFPTALVARSDREVLRLALRAHPHQPAMALWRATEFAMLRDITFPAPVLDLGCGTGEVARSVLRSHWPVDGLELVANEVRVANNSGVYRAVIQADGTRIPVESASYGAVYSHSVLEHIPSDLDAVTEAARVLQPGGRLIFTVPAPAFAERIERESGQGALESTNARLGHHHYRSLEEWTERLAERGLTVVASRGHLPAATQRTWRRLDELMVKRVGGRRVLDWFRGLHRRRLLLMPLWLGLWSALLWRPFRRRVREPGGYLIVAERLA
ncbi:MAG: class I SAM-dependent methyltransferase [Chloroflexi bacterium]|nr:class I SAM-dependent methyltransferase [Chloroflexota bacterium]